MVKLIIPEKLTNCTVWDEQGAVIIKPEVTKAEAERICKAHPEIKIQEKIKKEAE